MHLIERTEIEVTLKGLTRRPHTYHVSCEMGRKVRTMLLNAERERENCEDDDNELIPAEEVFPVLKDDVLRPATVLRGMRYRENLTQRALAQALGIRQHHLSEMEHAKRPIGKQMAKRLAKILRCDYRLFV